MKTLTLFLLYCCLLPLAAGAQTAEALLQKVPEAIASGQMGYAESLFRQACHANTSQAEMFYWTSVDKSSELAVRFAASLVECFKDAANYDKAYLFYKEQLAHKPDDVTLLVACGDVEVRRGKLADALETYEKVIGLDPDNLQACIFLGNYYYLKAENARKKLDADYRRIPSPTRMQYARYRNGLSEVFDSGYAKARTYLKHVMKLFPSTGADSTLERIDSLEQEIKP